MIMDENLTLSFEEQQRRRQEQLQEQQAKERQRGAAIFEKLAAASAIYSIIYTVCLYKNTAGITVLLWVLATIGYAHVTFRMFGIEKKRDSIFVMVVMSLLGISTFLTGNEWIICFNYMAIFLLLVALLLHNFAGEQNWDIGKYLAEIAVAVFGAVGCMGKPFADGNAFFKSRKSESDGRGRYIAVGIGIAIPCVMFLGMLLATADAVFADMMSKIFSVFRFPTKMIGISFMLLFGFFSSYCGIRFIEGHVGQVVVTDRKKGEPLIAITVTLLIALLYLIFCAIQIAYLFVGEMKLPEGVTYAEYARSGFFQLLFVCVLNLILVLVIKKYFRESRMLNILLLVISGCTFVMTASSAWRMLLYIKAYQLTFLRITVLVALFAIALLMVGVVAMILKPDFPLFRYGLVTVSVVYLAFSFAHVDHFIASYNLSHVKTSAECTGNFVVDYQYIYTLSTDAAPAIADYLKEKEEKKFPVWYEYYYNENRNVMENITIRNFNLSHYVARCLLGE